MTDITELAQSLKRRASSANEFGESLYVKADDVIALVEALEKAQQRNVELEQGCENDPRIHEIIDLKERIAELEESHAQVIQSRDHYKRISEEGLKKLAESRTVTVKLPQAVSAGGQGYQEKVERILTAAGIKWEAE